MNKMSFVSRRCVFNILLALLLVAMVTPVVAQYPPNIRISNVGSEVSIAINPDNPLNLAAGANINRYFYSTDGGLNWVLGTLTSSYGVWGDPCLVFDAQGNLYYAHLSNPPSPGYWIDRIVVQKSTNGGAAWNNGVGIGFNPPKNQDKEWLAVDMTDSPFRNNVYVAWTEFDSYGSNSPADSSRILFSCSPDFGETWSVPVRVSDRGGNCVDSDSTVEGAVPAVGPNGEVYLAWSGPLGIMFDKSTDGGVTFGTDVFVSDQPGGWDYTVPGIYRCNGFPITACDVSNSPYRGTIYVNWSDQRNGVGNTDVFLAKSTDGGLTWSTARKVNTDSTVRHQFFTWMTVDQTNGYLYFVFYDRRNTAGNATDVFVARSTDGGETFNDFRVNETSFTPSSSVFFGDYINIAALNRKVYPIWMRMDGSSLSVWTALIHDTTVVGIAEEEMQPMEFRLFQNYPNPFNPNTTIWFTLPDSRFTSLKIYNLVGQEVAMLINETLKPGRHEVTWDASGLPSGVYFYRLVSGNCTAARTSVLLK